MEQLQFYKEMYFKEIELKHKLDDKLNLPILLLSLIVSTEVYIFTHIKESIFFEIIKYNSYGILLLVIITFIYLSRSFMNLGKAYKYKEIATMNEYFEYNKTLKGLKQEEQFDLHLTKEFADCATQCRGINIQRTNDLVQAKKALFFCLTFLALNSIFFILSII